MAAGRTSAGTVYEKVCGTIPGEWGASGDMAIDATEETGYFRTGREIAAAHLPADAKPEKPFGPRNMGAGPTGIGSIAHVRRSIRTSSPPPITATYATRPPGATAIPRGYGPIGICFTTRPKRVETTLRSHVHQLETSTNRSSGVIPPDVHGAGHDIVLHRTSTRALTNESGNACRTGDRCPSARETDS